VELKVKKVLQVTFGPLHVPSVPEDRCKRAPRTAIRVDSTKPSSTL
jgi:hypothetical protein